MSMMDYGNLPGDRKHLEEILSRDEFRAYDQPEKGPSLQDRLFDWIAERFPELSLQPGGGQTFTYIVVAFILAVLLFIIIWLVRRMLKNRVVHKKAIFTDEDDLSKSSSDLLQDAERAAREGRYNEAIRYRFLAILMAMDELGWVRAERWKTNFEYREELKEGHAGAISSFSKAARIFEKVYYGRAPAGQQQYAELSQYGEDCMRKGGRNDAAD